jgi:hypothetical protein
MGPDLNEARKQGREVGAKLLAQLIKENKLEDITAPKNQHSNLIRLPNSHSRWDKAKQEFIRSVEELFVEDACNGF